MVKIAMVDKKLGHSLKGMRCAVSGSGNVALYAAEKLLEYEAKVITVSDSNGVLVFDNGMMTEDLAKIFKCKDVDNDRLGSLNGDINARYIKNESPWSIDVKYNLALPCATQNEIDENGAKLLVKNGVLGVFEVSLVDSRSRVLHETLPHCCFPE